ncbi:hypothetical protein EPO15_06200 [bacterium]|nr:MAG: hypothetical protein EPO15_06200 [bacterium]
MSEEHARCSRAGRSLAAGGVKSAVLGKDKRYAPDRSFDTLHVRLELFVDPSRRTLEGTCSTTVKAIKDGVRRLDFDAGGMTVLGASAGGKRVRFTLKGERLEVFLPKSLAAGADAEVSVRYRVRDPKRGFHFTGPSKETPDAPRQGWSQGQPEDAHYWFPCHDSPHEKATTEILARVPKGYVAVSNGVLLARKSEGARDSFHWRLDHPHSLYLVTLSVARFAEVADKWEDVPVLYYCEKGREEDAKRGFSQTKAALEVFSKKFGVRYPYERYAQVAVSEFPGGMENTTATTQTDACLLDAEAALDTDLDTLVAHELAHQWFGDLLTCRDWSHAWLNEGFATYSEYVFLEAVKGKDEADRDFELARRSYVDEDSARYRRPIVCNTYRHPWALFDRHLYEKGGWVLHMLRHELGDAPFWKSIAHYLRRFRDQSVETNDLIAAVEQTTGRNMRKFFDQWVYGQGYPTMETRWAHKADAGKVEVRVRQTGDLFEVPLTVRVTGPGGRWSREFTETVKNKDHVFTWRVPGEPSFVEVDPEHKLLKKLEAKQAVARWRDQLRLAKTALSRAQAANALSKWGDAASIKALETAARRDRFWYVSAEAAAALGTLRSDASRAALERLLTVKHPKVRRAVVAALAGWTDARAAKSVLRLAQKDPSIHVRGESLRALGRAKDPAYYPVLRAALKKPSYWNVVRSSAVQALSLTRDPAVLPDLLKAAKAPTPFQVRLNALRALSTWHQYDESVIPVIAGSLYSQDERVQMTAVSCLGDTGDARAIPHLEKLRDATVDTRVKTYCAEALSKLKAESDKT